MLVCQQNTPWIRPADNFGGIADRVSKTDEDKQECMEVAPPAAGAQKCKGEFVIIPISNEVDIIHFQRQRRH